MAGYTLKRLEEIPDVLGDYPGEMRLCVDELASEQVAFTYRRMPPGTGGRGGYGHRHKTQEEVYFVASGTLTFKLGDEIVEAGAGTVINVPGDVVRSVHNDGDSDAELVIVSQRNTTGEDDAVLIEGFWPD
jgi:mannose-6-phosphate isomerase-like protein (cupin superfamily)